MRITALSGGVGGARFLRGLVHHLRADPDSARRAASVTVIGNTADDITLHGLRVCPDLDTVMYTLGEGAQESQGWGRRDETFTVAGELAAYGTEPQWFALGDRDVATHILRTQLLGLGYPLSQVTRVLCDRWLGEQRLGDGRLGGRQEPHVTLLPMSDDPVETHVVVEDPAVDGGQRAIHFQEWWVRLHAAVEARRIVAVGAEKARPAPGVLEAIRDADVVLLPPSNPVVSIGTILAVPGVRDAVRGTLAPVVGVSPVIGGAPVRGMADACLRTLGLPATAEAVGGLYRDLLDGWLVDGADAALTELPGGAGARVVARPLLMTDVDAAADIAGATLDLAAQLGPR